MHTPLKILKIKAKDKSTKTKSKNKTKQRKGLRTPTSPVRDAKQNNSTSPATAPICCEVGGLGIGSNHAHK
jgi:hypothetical protein